MDEETSPSEGEDTSLFVALARAQEAKAQAERARPRKHRGDGYDDEMDPASGWLESADFDGSRDPDDFHERGHPEGGIEERDRRRAVFTRQVCIRLSAGQYAELQHAANLYGVAPGTMGRMLVRRGARAVLDSRRRYDLEVGGAD